MVELPEAIVISGQLAAAAKGKRLRSALAGESPHRFAWFNRDCAEYGPRLEGRCVTDCVPFAHFISLRLEGGVGVTFGEGVQITWHPTAGPVPAKRQFHATFDSGEELVGAVRMYGFLLLEDGETDVGPYLERARMAISPLDPAFTFEEFCGRVKCAQAEERRLTAKMLLAQKQRFPGVGNGVLQDVLWEAQLHPKARIGDLAAGDLERLHQSLVATLGRMRDAGGRSSETDLFGKPGGYQPVMGRRAEGNPCPRCGELVRREAYLGGAIVFCPGCQRDIGETTSAL